jgi:hypothetical protein
MKRPNIKLEDDVYRAANAEAAVRGETLSEFIAAAITLWLSRKGKP